VVISACIGLLTTFPALIAVSSGYRDGDLSTLALNLGINFAGMSIAGLLIQRDLIINQQRLERIQKGGRLAALNVKIMGGDGPLVVKLSDLRRDRGIEKRVVIVAAPKELLIESVKSSLPLSSDLSSNDLLVVPISINSVVNEEQSSSSISLEGIDKTINDLRISENLAENSFSHFGYPVGISQWRDIIESEFNSALKQSPDAVEKGVTIVIKKNGKVGSRRFGVPIWESLIGDIQTRKEGGLDTTNI